MVGDSRSLRCDVLSDLIVGVEVRSDDLHVDRGRRTHADHRIHQTAGGEERRELRHLLGHALS